VSNYDTANLFAVPGNEASLDFDGIDDFVEVPDANELDVGSNTTTNRDFTVSACIDADAFANDFNYIVSKDISPRVFNFNVDTGGHLFLGVFGPSGASSFLTGNTAIATGTSVHVAATYELDTADDSTRVLTVYVDGVQDGSLSEAKGVLNSSSDDIQIGRRGNAVRHFDGLIDDVRIYDVALGQDEIDILAATCGGIAGLTKGLTSGPDADGDGRIDVVVEVGQQDTTAYDFTIQYVPGNEEGALIEDTTPAEWLVILINDDDEGATNDPDLPISCGESLEFDVNANTGNDVEVFKGGKPGKKCKNSTHIAWVPDSSQSSESLKVDVETRESPGKGHKADLFAPTSCGTLDLNDGAVAFELDANGNLFPSAENPNVLGQTDGLCLAAVADLNGNGLFLDGTGDEDGDGLTDFDEACNPPVEPTDPCNADTDNDGVDDDIDLCPNEGLPDAGIGELLDSDGCIFQSECSDTVDNDSDSLIDFGSDPECASILDDDEFLAGVQ